MPSTNDREKAWDTDDIDKWKIEPFKVEGTHSPLAEQSSFSILFPQYRETYIRSVWTIVTKRLESVGVSCTLDLIQGCMSVATTLKTFDPSAILDARDVIKLLARSVPASEALKVLNDGVACDIVKIRGLVRNKERFVKRRQRVVGPNASTLKALQLLTDTYIVVQGNTVSIIGPFKGLKTVRRIVEDAMANIHPIYAIKELMIKRELSRDPQLANESWDRFLPNFKRRTISKRRVPFKVTDKSKRTYTPFPPPREKSKVDMQLESGEFFLDRHARGSNSMRDRDKIRKKNHERRRIEREKLSPGASGKINDS